MTNLCRHRGDGEQQFRPIRNLTLEGGDWQTVNSWHFTLRGKPVTLVQEAGWSWGPVWTARKISSHRDSIRRPSSQQRFAEPATPFRSVRHRTKLKTVLDAGEKKDVNEMWRKTDQTFTSAVTQLVEELCYKPEGRGFDSHWCHGNISLT